MQGDANVCVALIMQVTMRIYQIKTKKCIKGHFLEKTYMC
jgi:hypothetical protein